MFSIVIFSFLFRFPRVNIADISKKESSFNFTLSAFPSPASWDLNLFHRPQSYNNNCYLELVKFMRAFIVIQQVHRIRVFIDIPQVPEV